MKTALSIILLLASCAVDAQWAGSYGDQPFLSKALPAASGGGGGSTTWITSSFTGGAEVNSGDTWGIKITVGASNITITDLGMYATPSSFEPVVLQIYDSSCNAISGATATPDVTAHDGQYHFAAVTTPPTLTAGGVYYIRRVSGNDYLYINITVSTSAAATFNDGTFSPCSPEGVSKKGPINFKYL